MSNKEYRDWVVDRYASECKTKSDFNLMLDLLGISRETFFRLYPEILKKYPVIASFKTTSRRTTYNWEQWDPLIKLSLLDGIPVKAIAKLLKVPYHALWDRIHAHSELYT